MCVHLWSRDSELASHTVSRDEKKLKGTLRKTRCEKNKSVVLFFSLILSYLCPHLSSTTTFITELYIPYPFRFLAVFFFYSELNKCSLFPHTSAITVCFSLPKPLQGSHQQHRQLCHSLRKQRMRDVLLEWTRRSFNLVKKGDISSSLPPPLSPSICPCTSSPSSFLTSPHTLHGSETESSQVSMLFTWTLGNVKVCLGWTQVRTISFLTLTWFTWPLLTLPLSVSALNLRSLCVWLMQRAFLWARLLQSSFTLTLSLPLSSFNGPLWKELLLNPSLFAQSTLRSQAQIWFYSSAGRYNFYPAELFLSISFPLELTSSARSILS